VTEEFAEPTPGDAATDRLSGGGAAAGSLAMLRDGDWRSVVTVAVPILLAAVLGAQLVLLSVWLVAGDAGSAVGGLGVTNYLRGLACLLPTAFLAGVRADFGDNGLATGATVNAAPLTTTALVLATAWFAVRRSARGDRGQRITLAVRVSVLVALTMLVVALSGRIKLSGGGGSVHADPLQAFFGPLLLLLVVCLLAAREEPLPRPAWITRWLPASRPALTGITAAVVLGWVAVLVAALLETRGNEASVTDVLKLVPGALAFGPNIGQAGAHVGMLGSISAGLGAFVGSSLDIGLFDRHGLSAWYWFFVLIPLLAVPIAVRSAVRSSASQGEADSRLAAIRVAVPFAVYWTVLALLTRLRVSAVVFGSSVGIPLWQAIALPLVIVPVFAWLLAARLRGPAPAPSRGRFSALTPVTLAMGYAVVCVGLAGGAAAAHQLSHGSGLLGDAERSSSRASVSTSVSGSGSATTIAPTPLSPVEAALKNAAIAEETYYTDNGSYTDDETQLDIPGGTPPGVSLDIRNVNETGYCIVGMEIGQPDTTFTYDSVPADVSEGDNC
jgi:hypothetical protein